MLLDDGRLEPPDGRLNASGCGATRGFLAFLALRRHQKGGSKILPQTVGLAAPRGVVIGGWLHVSSPAVVAHVHLSSRGLKLGGWGTAQSQRLELKLRKYSLKHLTPTIRPHGQ